MVRAPAFMCSGQKGCKDLAITVVNRRVETYRHQLGTLGRSTAELGSHPNQTVYNTLKGAQAYLTRCLAIEYGEKGISVNGICPTYAKTALTRARFDDKDFDEAFKESIPRK